MIEPSQKYLEALAAIANGKGTRNCKLLPRAACLAVRAGVCESAFVADVRDVYPDAGEYEIKAALKSAQTYIGQTAVRGAYVTRAKPKPPRFPSHVRNVLAGLDADKGAPDWLRVLSPFDVRRLTPTEQTAAFLRAAFRPDERLFVFKSDGPTVGRPGANIRTCDEWLNDIEAVRQYGDLAKTNPLTGERGRTKNGQPSYVSQDCLAAYPFALIEFDAMPLPMQYAFWRGFILSHKLAPALVSLVYSAGKSVHGLLYVGCRTLLEWQAVRRRLIDLFSADSDGRFRIDPQALHPLIGTRIPGVTRRGNGTLQELLYLNPAARHSPPQAAEQIATPEAPPPPAAEPQTAYRWTCDSCGCDARCREAWGRFWAEKSHGGRGCSAPVRK